MKKLLSALLFLVLIGESALAVPFNLLSFSSDVSTTGGKTITVNLTAVSGRKIAIYNIFGRSDLSTSVIQVQRADATGTTGNYTTKFRLDVGSATKQWNNSGAPIFVGEGYYSYRFLLDSTTANSMSVTYGYE